MKSEEEVKAKVDELEKELQRHVGKDIRYLIDPQIGILRWVLRE